jgi:hypothetical protein
MHPNMNMKLSNRLNEIESAVTSSDFLHGKGLGNEIPFYIFDYPPEDEMTVRDHLQLLLGRLETHSKLNVLYIDLFELLISYLKERKIYEKSLELEATKGVSSLKKALEAPLKAENLVKQLSDKYSSSNYDLVILSGVGKVYPLIRSHSLLNNLQPVMGNTPLILFYPGRYDGKNLRLFGKVESNPYYRAFRLIP